MTLPDDSEQGLQPVLAALRGAGSDVWEWDVEADRLRGTFGFARGLGYAPAALPRSQAEWDALIHPEDLGAYRRAFDEHLRGTRPMYAVRYRMRAVDAQWHWVDERGRIVERQPDGTPRRVIGTLTDVSPQVELQAQAEQAAQRLHALARHVPGLLFQFRRAADGSASFPYVSERCEALLGLDREAMQRDAAAMLRKVEREQRERMLASIDASARTLAPWQLQFCLWRDGAQRCLRGSATPQREPDGAVTWHGHLEDVTELLGMEQVQRDKLAAEAASRSKSEFLSHMSHELRTPLNAVLGFAQLLEIDRASPPTPAQRDKLRLIRESGTHLLRMIGDLLDLSRIETGRLALQTEPVALPALMGEVVEMMQADAERAGVALAADPPPPWLPHALADATRLRQVLLNLLSNAIKYNRPGGRAWLSLNPGTGDDAGRVGVSVHDDGPGIAEDEMARLFEPFFRGRRIHGAVEGAGIGLTVTRALVDAMDGRIEARSRPGEGSVFAVWLPAAAADRPA